ncbi:MAG: glycosyltransferase family 39 protein [Armatimonadetes bacterium]|nr:glycosyltransferase family 39 protein [Armatimonadota bacterium]
MSKSAKPQSLLSSQTFQIAAMLFIIALMPRLMGIGWGLPNSLHNHSYHPDEHLNWLVSRHVSPLQGQFLPGYYNYGTLYFSLMRIAGDFAAAYSGGAPSGNAAMDPAFVAKCILAGRFLNVIFGSLAASVVFLLMRRWTGKAGSIFAGLVIAFAPGLVMHSDFATVDMLSFLLFVLSAHFALKLIPAEGETPLTEKQQWKWVLLSAACAGLSASAKYPGILAFGTLAAVLLYAAKPKAVQFGGAGFLVALVAFILGTPAALLDRDKFVQGLTDEIVHSRTGHDLVFAGTAPGWIYHLSNLFQGVGILITLLGLSGLIYGCLQRKTWLICLTVSFVLTYLAIGGSEVKFLRYTFPLDLAIAAGSGWMVGLGHLQKGRSLILVAIGILGLGGLDAGGFRAAMENSAIMAAPEARDRGALYIKQQYAGKSIGVVTDPWYYTPPIYPDTGMLRAPWPIQEQAIKAAQGLTVVRYVPANPDERQEWDPRLITEYKPDAIVFSNFETDARERFLRNGAPAGSEGELKKYQEFKRLLESQYQLDRAFGIDPGPIVQDMMYVRPYIQIWKRKPA